MGNSSIGGALRFGPDGHLHVALRDGRNPHAAQSPAMLQGKVLKIDREGASRCIRPKATAPWPGTTRACMRWGLRNPHEAAQRLELVLFEREGRIERTAVALKGLGFGFGAVAAQADGALFVATRGKPGGDEIWRLTLY